MVFPLEIPEPSGIVRIFPGSQRLRVGIVVGRKVANAVIRNKIKRRLRALFQKLAKTYCGDCIVVVKNPALASYNFESLFSCLASYLAHYQEKVRVCA